MINLPGKLLIAAVLVLACSGCMGGGSKVASNQGGLNLIDSDALPAPSAADFTASAVPFVVGPYDTLDISVFGNEDLRVEDVQVDAGGRITFPLLGTLDVSGRTPGEVGQMMEALLRGRYLRNPQVTVNLKETASQVVTISGEIKRPGIYPIVGEMTLLKAIARGEGWTEFSKKREVLVFRTVNRKKYVAIYNVQAIERGQYADPTLFANDTVVVGDSQAARNLKNIIAVAPALLTPIIILLQ